MASFVPGVTDTPQSFNTSLGSPDFSFLQQNLYRSNQQYEQGLSQIKQDYSAITSAPLTNGENIDKRNEYVAQIQEGLKKVAPTDVSLPQNVQQAEQLYAPFWKDTDLLQDQSITKDVSNKLQQADGDRQSKDEKIRNSYNPWSVARQQYVLEDLRNAKRGNGSIGKVQRADYLPIDDYQAYVDEQDKLQGFKGITVERNIGPSLITDVNGVGALPQLRTRYDAMLGSKFQPQFAQQGWVEHRQELDAVARLHPEIPREELNNQLASNKYQELLKFHNDNINRTSSDLYTTYQMPIKAINDLKQAQGGRLTKLQQNNLDRLENGYVNSDGVQVPGQKQFEEHLSQLSTQRDQFTKANPGEKLSDIVNNPENYYGQLVRARTVEKLADTQASNYTHSVELNKIWDVVQTHRENQAHINLDRQKLGIESQKNEWEHEHWQNEDRAKYLDLGINPATGEKTVDPTAGTTTQLTGENQTDQQHVDFGNVLNQQKSQYMNVVANALFGGNGSANVLQDLKVGDEDLLHYKTLMSRLYTNENINNTSFSFKPEERVAFQNVRHALIRYLGHDIPNTYNDVVKAQNEYVGSELKRRSGDLKHPMGEHDPYTQAYMSNKTAADALQSYAAKVNEEQTALSHLGTADRETNHQLLNDNGTKFADVSDVAKYAPELQVTDVKTGQPRTITPQEYAEAYLHKNLQHTDGNHIKINGREYNIHTVNGQNNNTVIAGNDYQERDQYPALNALENVTNRFGTYDERDKLNQNLQTKVASAMPSVVDHTGKTGMDILYGYGNDKTPGNGEKMIMETLNPANTTSYNFRNADGELDPMSAKDQNILRTLSGSYADIRKNMGQPHYNTVSSSGQEVVQYTTDKWPDGNGGTTTKTIEIPLSPRPTGELLSTIPKSSGLYVYGKLLKGEIVKNDPTDEHMGFKYSVVPDNADNPTSVTVKSQHIQVASDGTESWVSDTPLPIQIKGNAAWNPDLIMKAVSEREMKTIAALASQRKAFNANNLK